MDVDAALVRLARERGATLITVDHNLAQGGRGAPGPRRPDQRPGVEVPRSPYSAGDELTVRLVKEGREHGQAVGYLDDGTMVVVEKAVERIGSRPSVKVTNVIQTTTGRMVFGTLAPEIEAADSG